jgi:hypothetical protein
MKASPYLFFSWPPTYSCEKERGSPNRKGEEVERTGAGRGGGDRRLFSRSFFSLSVAAVLYLGVFQGDVHVAVQARQHACGEV